VLMKEVDCGLKGLKEAVRLGHTDPARW